MRRASLFLGLIIAMLSGTVFGYAWLANNAAWWWVGCLSMLSGVLMLLSGLHLRSSSSGVESAAGSHEGKPLLGELLTLRYGLITEADLQRALARQRKTRQRLGMILVEMGALTFQQLAEVLEEQISRHAASAPALQPEA